MTNIYDNCENVNDIINKYNLPENLKKRMIQDCSNNEYISRVQTFTFTQPNSSEKMATIMKAEGEKEIAVLQSRRIVELANAEAEQITIKANAEAKQITIKANSTAQSIIEIAKANAEADKMLPNSEGIGYKTMLAEHMKGVLSGAKLNIFSGNTPTSLINMLSESAK